MTQGPRNPSAGIVHVVDDDANVRKALARLLGVAGFDVRAYASGAEYLLAPVNSDQQPACVILDVRMPGPSGLDLHDALLRRSGALPVVFLTGHGNIPMSVRAMKAVAVDFLTKPVQRAALLAAVRAALARHAATRSGDAAVRELRQRFESLTPRERDVFAGVVAGRLNKQIASDLGAAERTVKAYRARVMEKMNAGSVAELARIAEKLRESGPGSGEPSQ